LDFLGRKNRKRRRIGEIVFEFLFNADSVFRYVFRHDCRGYELQDLRSNSGLGYELPDLKVRHIRLGGKLQNLKVHTNSGLG